MAIMKCDSLIDWFTGGIDYSRYGNNDSDERKEQLPRVKSERYFSVTVGLKVLYNEYRWREEELI